MDEEVVVERSGSEVEVLRKWRGSPEARGGGARLHTLTHSLSPGQAGFTLPTLRGTTVPVPRHTKSTYQGILTPRQSYHVCSTPTASSSLGLRSSTLEARLVLKLLQRLSLLSLPLKASPRHQRHLPHHLHQST
jgi:hypothetical protein